MKVIKLFTILLLVAFLFGHGTDYFSNALDTGAKPLYSQATATTSAVVTSLSPGGEAVKIFNRSTSVDLLYSYDGSTYFSLPPRAAVNERISSDNIYFKTASGTAAYDLKAAIQQ